MNDEVWKIVWRQGMCCAWMDELDEETQIHDTNINTNIVNTSFWHGWLWALFGQHITFNEVTECGQFAWSSKWKVSVSRQIHDVFFSLLFIFFVRFNFSLVVTNKKFHSNASTKSFLINLRQLKPFYKSLVDTSISWCKTLQNWPPSPNKYKQNEIEDKPAFN